MHEVTPLPLAERIRFYRRLAEKAQRDARESRGTLRLAFVRSAARWEVLANAAEQLAASGLPETADGHFFYGPSSVRERAQSGLTRMSTEGREW